MSTTFGPTALATPANVVTLARVALTPVLLAVVLGPGPSWPALALWVALASTDGVDGWVARRQGTTRSGAFLDPLADKFLVLGALVCLVSTGAFWWLPVAVIALREVAISAWRSRLGRLGVSMPAIPLAKVKTWVQSVAVGLALAPTTAEDHPVLADIGLWLALALTLVSGAQYVTGSRRAGGRPAPVVTPP